MKKASRSLLMAAMSILLIFSLAACQKNEQETSYEPDSAVALWEKVDETMSAMQSMETTLTTQVVYYYMGYKFELNGSGRVVSTADAHYSESQNVVVCDELSMSQTVSSVKAYYDGKMYTSVQDGTYDQKFCSVMTKEEFVQTQSGVLTEEIELSDCLKAEFSKRENKGWKLQFSGYTKKAIDKVLEVLSLADDILGAPIADMEVKLETDQQFQVEKIEISFLFDAEEMAGEAMPTFSVTAVYSGFNTTTFDSAVLKVEEYTEVDDVRVLNDVSEALQERQNAASDQFRLMIKTTYDMPGQNSTYVENDIVEYGRKNGAYCYLIDAEVEGQHFAIQYKNGEQTVTTNGETRATKQPEEQAKAFIDSLIDSARYNVNAVTDIQMQEEGTYLISIAQCDVTAYAPTLENSGIENISGTQQIIVVFAEDQITQVSSIITICGESDAGSVTITVESDVSFGEKVDTEQM